VTEASISRRPNGQLADSGRVEARYTCVQAPMARRVYTHRHTQGVVDIRIGDVS